MRGPPPATGISANLLSYAPGAVSGTSPSARSRRRTRPASSANSLAVRRRRGCAQPDPVKRRANRQQGDGTVQLAYRLGEHVVLEYVLVQSHIAHLPRAVHPAPYIGDDSLAIRPEFALPTQLLNRRQNSYQGLIVSACFGKGKQKVGMRGDGNILC